MDQNILLSKLTCIHGRLLNHPKLQRSFRNCFQMLIVSGGFSGQAILASTEVIKKSTKKKKTQCPGLGLHQPWQGMEVCRPLTQLPIPLFATRYKYTNTNINKYTNTQDCGLSTHPPLCNQGDQCGRRFLSGGRICW